MPPKVYWNKKAVNNSRISDLRKEIEDIENSLNNLKQTNSENKIILKEHESNVRQAYYLVQSGQCSLEEFNDFIKSIEELQFSIEETKKVIKVTEMLLYEKREELRPLEKKQNEENARGILIVSVALIVFVFVVSKIISSIFKISILGSFCLAFLSFFVFTTAISIYELLTSAISSLNEKRKK